MAREALCRARYRFVFIDPVILPPSFLITRLHGYPRGSNSRVKKKDKEQERKKERETDRERERQTERGREKKREKSCTCLIWFHVSRQINVGSSCDQAKKSLCLLLLAWWITNMGSAPHARGTKRHCPKFFRCVRRDFRYPFLHYPHLQIKRNHLKEMSLLFLNSRIPRRLYLARRVRSRHEMTHSLSLILYWKNFFFLLLFL